MTSKSISDKSVQAQRNARAGARKGQWPLRAVTGRAYHPRIEGQIGQRAPLEVLACGHMIWPPVRNGVETPATRRRCKECATGEAAW